MQIYAGFLKSGGKHILALLSPKVIDIKNVAPSKCSKP